MSLLAFSEVSYEYSIGLPLFVNVSFSVNPGEHLAVVGPNGAGKTTLLRLLAGDLEPVRGSVVRRRDLRIAVAGQDIPGMDDQTLFDFTFGALPELALLHKRLQDLQQRLSDPPSALQYSARINEYEERGGFHAEAAIARTLSGLGYAAEDFDRRVRSFSGGERTRALLARALSSDVDLLILDEPTNHLDLTAREWLEQRLASRPVACVVASHDRGLLSRFAGRVVEVERGKVRTFEGGYADYRRARALLDRQAWSAYEAFVRRKEAVERAARRRDRLAVRVATPPKGLRGRNDFYAHKAAKVSRTGRILRKRVSGLKQVDKPWEEKVIGDLSFEGVARAGDVALVADALTKTYGDRTLFRNLGFHLYRGDRLAIVGPNGCGKTTLLKVIEGVVVPDAGSVRLGANVRIAGVGQDTGTQELSLTPLEVCGTSSEARTLLGCLKLPQHCLNRPLHELSGGERTKTALARILTSGASLLLLDEPTNHLEIEAQEALEQALDLYPGTLIVVSHDRFFLDALGPNLTCLTLGGGREE